MGDHSYGHGQFCHYCGVDGDTDDDKPCDESINKKATPAELAEMDHRRKVANQIHAIVLDYEIGIIELVGVADAVRELSKVAANG